MKQKLNEDLLTTMYTTYIKLSLGRLKKKDFEAYKQSLADLYQQAQQYPQFNAQTAAILKSLGEPTNQAQSSAKDVLATSEKPTNETYLRRIIKEEIKKILKENYNIRK